MNKVTVYRHKTEKNIYLIRNWGLCGGGPMSNFYEATTDFYKAVREATFHIDDDFMKWGHSFLDENGLTKLVAKVTLSKEMEFDGYTGILKKVVAFPVYEFEPVILKEDIK